MNDLTYSQRSELAATRQGLDPARALLQAAGFEPETLNTGGYCMALVEEGVGGTLVVTAWDNEPGEYMVGAYKGTDWLEAEGPARFAEAVPLADLVSTVEAFADHLADTVLDPACVTCGASINANLSGETAALYRSETSTVIIGWACSDVCSAAWEAKTR